MLTDEQLKEIKERCEAATPGPWANNDNVHEIFDSEPIDWWHVYATNINPRYKWPMVVCRMSSRATEEEKEEARKAFTGRKFKMFDPGQAGIDANFISHSRTDIPALLEHICAQKYALEQAWYVLDAATTGKAPKSAAVAARNRVENIIGSRESNFDENTLTD